jgi:asparagine synthase (glutamine-hydrolysing)
MTATLVHRGPDGGGTWQGDHVALGHRRLAVLDPTAAGAQPMHLGDLALTYNGEIYNFRSLRDELPGPFTTRTDTEVLLHRFRRDGEACLDALDGMFAFAIWDARTRTLFAARDRFGVKPLYYRETPDAGLAFASELKALLALGRPEIEPSAVWDFFTYRYMPAPKTFFRGIHALPAAHCLTFRDGRLDVRRWWSPEVEKARTDPLEALDELDSRLREAVRSHTVSDVPLGVFLSGGLDSTAIVSQLERPRTFTLGFDVATRDERDDARAIAAHFGTNHTDQGVAAVDVAEALAHMPELYDEPFGDSSAWATHLLARAARRDVTVALSGDGGDEAFSGYGWYATFSRFEAASPLASRLAAIAAAWLPPFSPLGRSASRRGDLDLERYAALVGPFDARQKRALLTPDFVPDDYDDLWALRRHWREELEPWKRMQWLDLHTFLPDDILVKVDRASMAASLEVRPPLLDHRLVELALSLDPSLLRDARGGKRLLRDWLAKRVPASVIERPKRGFSMPVRRWIETDPSPLDAALTRLEREGWLRTRRRPRRRPRLGSDQIWCLLVLDRWMQSAV